jgi:dGTP triphosphohydrolase
MEKKYTLILDNEFVQYCELNKITNINELAKETFNKGFSLLKYGETPKSIVKIEEKVIEKEVIREVPVERIVEVIKEIPVEKEIIREVPVEIIKEVIKEVEVVREVKGEVETIVNEIIREVPVEVIKEVIKEVAVEKIIHVENTIEIELLKKENEDLKSELNKITEALESFNRSKVIKTNNTNDLYDE